jgi:hypothetical protein
VLGDTIPFAAFFVVVALHCCIAERMRISVYIAQKHELMSTGDINIRVQCKRIDDLGHFLKQRSWKGLWAACHLPFIRFRRWFTHYVPPRDDERMPYNNDLKALRVCLLSPVRLVNNANCFIP